MRCLTAVIPLLCKLLGYYPGDRVGFWGREARGLMADWWQMVQQDDCPVLAIYCGRDNFGYLAGVQGVTKRLGNRNRNRNSQWQEITSEALGSKADHASWAKRPAIVVSAISAWIEQQKNKKQE